jgi:FtsH-binding integral membrane protein
MASTASKIWGRATTSRQADTMSRNLFAFSVSSLTVLGILVSLGSSRISSDWQFASVRQLLGLFALVLVAGFAGVTIANRSDSPLTSFIGYMMVAVPFGLMLGPVAAQYTEASVTRVFVLTTIIVTAFGVVGAVLPDNLEGWGSYLLMGLLALIGGYIVVPLLSLTGVNGTTAMNWIDWAGIALFCVIVVFDWNRAMRLPKTWDNAVDSAVAIYLDWFNIAVRLLSVSGQRRS